MAAACRHAARKPLCYGSLKPEVVVPDGSSELTWTAHPARERVGAAVGTLLTIVAFAGVVYLACGWLGPVERRVVAGVAGLVLVASLHRFFFPSRFEIDADGITARYLLRTQRFTWSRLRRFTHDQRGGYLSSRGRASRFDAYRGLHILFGDQRERVIERVRSHLADHDRQEHAGVIVGEGCA
jgi:hypothetical protein